MEISNPVLFSEEYSCRQILPKIGSFSIYLQNLYEYRTFLNCNIFKILLAYKVCLPTFDNIFYIF